MKKLGVTLTSLLMCLIVLGTISCDSQGPTAQGVSFTDSGIEAAIRAATGLGSGPINIPDLESLTKLDASGSDISSISDLRYCINLTEFHLWSSQVSDIETLSSLTKLTSLSLESNEISDISPLSSLTGLIRLHLLSNRISDVSALSSLINLTELNLGNNRIRTISALSSLTNLSELDLWGNEIEDVSPLVENSGLIEGDILRLRKNNLDLWVDNLDVSEASDDLRSIRTLQDRGVRVSHDQILVKVTFPDANLGAAIREALGKKPAEDITSAELASLISLDATYRGIADLTGIEYCSNLAYLTLGGNGINDLTPLSSLTSLLVLGLESNRISDISPLSPLSNLVTLGLSMNEISDISPLSPLTALTRLSLNSNRISDISPLLENSGLGKGDEIWLLENNLHPEESPAIIEALRDRGVVVNVTPP